MDIGTELELLEELLLRNAGVVDQQVDWTGGDNLGPKIAHILLLAQICGQLDKLDVSGHFYFFGLPGQVDCGNNHFFPGLEELLENHFA